MSFYTFFNTLSSVVLTVYNLLQYKKKVSFIGGVSRSAITYVQSKQKQGVFRIFASTAFWAILELLLVSAVQYNYVGFLNAGASKLFKTGANYFGVLFGAPILVVLLCVILRIDPLAQLDLVTPAYPLGLIFVKIACYKAGCCSGVAWIGGLESPVIIPVQLIESAAAALLFVFLLCTKRKMKKGTVFPVYLITYSGLRFFTEFFRCEPKVFMGLRTYQIICIAAVLVGVLEYVAVRLYDGHLAKRENASIGNN